MDKQDMEAATRVAHAYGRMVEKTSGGVWLLNAESDDYAAFISDAGAVRPYDTKYTRADHECAMAIRATFPLN
jgi:hypothetical protein